MKLMVIDGNSILNRAYYGIRPLTTRDGLYTHAIFGFLTTLLRLEGEEAPDALCVTFDVHAPTFRHQASEAYKATRKPMPEELRVQVPVLKEVLDALNIPRYEQEGWEADDLIGTISRKCEADGWDCVVVTGDKDSLQLITDHTMVKLVSTRMGQTTTKDMTETAFQEQYGFAPIHMIDLKALMGDSSDNIPGVPGIGEKTAMALIQQYESIDNLYAKNAGHRGQACRHPQAGGGGGERPGVLLAGHHRYRRASGLPSRGEPVPEARPGRLPACFLEAGVHQADREVRPVPGGAASGGKGGLHHDRGAGHRACSDGAAAGPLASGGPCIGAGPART